MKSPLHQARRVEGMVIIFALLVVLVGTVVLAAWVQVLATRALAADTAMQAQQRRIALGNAQALARQYFLQEMPSGSLTVTNANAEISGGWGGFTIAGRPNNFWNPSGEAFFRNPFNSMGGWSFIANANGTLTAGGATEPWRFRVRTYSPVFAGIPVVINNPEGTNLLNSQPRRLVWTNFSGFVNIPRIPTTWGVNPTNTNNNYAGFFSGSLSTNFSTANVTLTTNISGTEFSAWFGYTNATTSRVDLIINPPVSTNTVRVIYNIPGTVFQSTGTRRLTNNNGSTVYSNRTHTVRHVRITGQSATNFVQVVFPSSAEALSIVLDGSNSRPVAISATGRALTISNSVPNAMWRSSVTLSNSPLTLTANGTLTISGLRTDSAVSVTGGLEFVPESPAGEGGALPPSELELRAERLMWLEDNRPQ